MVKRLPDMAHTLQKRALRRDELIATLVGTYEIFFHLPKKRAARVKRAVSRGSSGQKCPLGGN
jgi:hypothetical protein